MVLETSTNQISKGKNFPDFKAGNPSDFGSFKPLIDSRLSNWTLSDLAISMILSLTDWSNSPLWKISTGSLFPRSLKVSNNPFNCLTWDGSEEKSNA
ncbi:hypothetical protein WICPIJ_006797 [Wickerhamomyces pijperi]|uniref:Uncharacterized protein n=1 Tax=Wickerhamomyces pijperi TaxID=599730 RepID=A0A9P8Q3M0_WICPI|nr:hypothetical protein WICPIJ_006797 [Wickerhamomyces pijperi]